MANTINFNVTSIASNEAEINGLKGTRKEIGEKVNSIKVESYAQIIAELATNGVTLIKRGKKSGLHQDVTGQLRESLLESGVPSHSVKRYVENTNALLRVKPHLLQEPTATRVEMALQADGLTSESKIHGAGHPKAPDHEMQAVRKEISKLTDYDRINVLALGVAELTDDERVRFDELVKTHIESAKAKAEKLEQAAENADAINATLEALDAA